MEQGLLVDTLKPFAVGAAIVFITAMYVGVLIGLRTQLGVPLSMLYSMLIHPVDHPAWRQREMRTLAFVVAGTVAFASFALGSILCLFPDEKSVTIEFFRIVKIVGAGSGLGFLALGLATTVLIVRAALKNR